MESEKAGSEPTLDSICKTCHRFATNRLFQSYPYVRFLCACGYNNFDGRGGKHHSGEGGAFLEPEETLKTSNDEKANPHPEIKGSGTSSTTQLSDSETGGRPGEAEKGGQHHPGKGRAEQTLKTSFEDHIRILQPEIQESCISSTTQIPDSETGGGPAAEGGQGGQGDGLKENSQLEIQGAGTSSTIHISNSETGGGPAAEGGQGGQGDGLKENRQLEIQGAGTSSTIHISNSETGGGPAAEGGQGRQGDGLKENRQLEIQGAGTSSTIHISNSETGGGLGKRGQGEQVMRKEIANQEFKDPVMYSAQSLRIMKREVDQIRGGGQGGQGDERGNLQPGTEGTGTPSTTLISDFEMGGGPGHGLQGGQGDEKGYCQPEFLGFGTSSTTEISDSETGGRPEEDGQEEQVMRKDIASMEYKDPIDCQVHRFRILKRVVEKFRKRGQGEQVMREEIASQEFEDPVMYWAQSYRIVKREVEKDQEGGQGRLGDERGNPHSETQGPCGTSSTTQISDSEMGGGPREGRQGVQGDEKGSFQPDFQGFGTASTTQTSESETGGGPGERRARTEDDATSPIDFPWQL